MSNIEKMIFAINEHDEEFAKQLSLFIEESLFENSPIEAYNDFYKWFLEQTKKKYVVLEKKEKKNITKWECTECEYIYDSNNGDPYNDIKPGTDFINLPFEWVCPECGAPKDVFRQYEG